MYRENPSGERCRNKARFPISCQASECLIGGASRYTTRIVTRRGVVVVMVVAVVVVVRESTWQERGGHIDEEHRGQHNHHYHHDHDRHVNKPFGIHRAYGKLEKRVGTRGGWVSLAREYASIRFLRGALVVRHHRLTIPA